MRRLVLASLLVGAVACDSGRGLAPDASVISVRIRDDTGAPAGRNQVLLTMSAVSLNASTKGDGTADVTVESAGTYRVTVVPRAGFVGGQAGLTKVVTVVPGSQTVVEFTVNRVGTGPGDVPPEPEIYGGTTW
jgi:hypothetical protein